MRDIQEQFKHFFTHRYPSSPYAEMRTNAKYSLQKALFITFNQWLDKRMTLANWGCGIDLALGTYKNTNGPHHRRSKLIEEEKEIRRLMIEYAMNDCFTVTRLVEQMEQWQRSTSPVIIEQDEMIVERRETLTELQPTSEQWFTVPQLNEPSTSIEYLESRLKNVNEEDQLKDHLIIDQWMVHDSDEPRKHVHLDESFDHQEPTEMKQDEEMNSNPPRRIIINYIDDEPNRSEQQRHTSIMVHVRDGSNEVEYSHRLDSSQPTRSEPMSKPSRNRIANERKRAKRYRYEVVRRLYHKFSITKVKWILKAMNIFYININIVGNILFIGLKNSSIVEQVESLLHENVFTEKHYQRLYSEDKSRKHR